MNLNKLFSVFFSLYIRSSQHINTTLMYLILRRDIFIKCVHYKLASIYVTFCYFCSILLHIYTLIHSLTSSFCCVSLSLSLAIRKSHSLNCQSCTIMHESFSVAYYCFSIILLKKDGRGGENFTICMMMTKENALQYKIVISETMFRFGSQVN